MKFRRIEWSKNAVVAFMKKTLNACKSVIDRYFLKFFLYFVMFVFPLMLMLALHLHITKFNCNQETLLKQIHESVMEEPKFVKMKIQGIKGFTFERLSDNSIKITLLDVKKDIKKLEGK